LQRLHVVKASGVERALYLGSCPKYGNKVLIVQAGHAWGNWIWIQLI